MSEQILVVYTIVDFVLLSSLEKVCWDEIIKDKDKHPLKVMMIKD